MQNPFILVCRHLACICGLTMVHDSQNAFSLVQITQASTLGFALLVDIIIYKCISK